MSAAEKIRAHTLAQEAKTGPTIARARVTRRTGVSTKNTQNLQELLAPYLPAAIKAWVDALKATKRMFNPITREYIVEPDHKVRGDNGQRIVEFLIGKAIERSMEVSGSYEELGQVLERLQKSPEAKRLLSPALFESLHKAHSVESPPAAAEGETISQSEQKTG